MRTRIAHGLIGLGLIGILFLLPGNSSEPLDGLSGAPGDFDCTFCHTPGGASQQGNLEIVGFPSVIAPLATYPIEIRINKTSGIARTAGFELLLIEGNSSSSESVGTWTTSDPFVTISTNANNRTYVKHGVGEYQYDETFNGPETIIYTAEWTAPAAVNDGIWIYGIANIGGFPEGTDGDLIVTQVLSDIPLPVDLISFELTRQPNGLSLLRWSTASESNSAYYAVLRSTNGRSFEEIGRMDAAGFSSNIRHYEFADPRPFTNGVSFYKLRMVDLDGRFHYSMIRSLNARADSDIKVTVFPNPLRHGECIFIEVATPRDLREIKATVWRQDGTRVLSTDPGFKPAGMHLLAMDPGHLTPGAYSVVVEADGEHPTVRQLVVVE